MVTKIFGTNKAVTITSNTSLGAEVMEIIHDLEIENATIIEEE